MRENAKKVKGSTPQNDDFGWEKAFGETQKNGDMCCGFRANTTEIGGGRFLSLFNLVKNREPLFSEGERCDKIN